MEARDKIKRMHLRNAFVCIICVIVCIVIDVRRFLNVGLYINWQLIVSFALYIVLIVLGIRSFFKYLKMKKENVEDE